MNAYNPSFNKEHVCVFHKMRDDQSEERPGPPEELYLELT
jgi:hypothetical protein